MAAKLTRPTHKTAIQLHLEAESCTICSSRPRRPVRKLLGTHLYMFVFTPSCRILVEKLIATQLVKNSFLYGTRRFIIVFTKARQWTLS
jgi:hypothetical protein